MFSVDTVNVLPEDFLNNIFFSPAYFTVRMQHITHAAYKLCLTQLFMSSVWLPVKNYM